MNGSPLALTGAMTGAPLAVTGALCTTDWEHTPEGAGQQRHEAQTEVLVERRQPGSALHRRAAQRPQSHARELPCTPPPPVSSYQGICGGREGGGELPRTQCRHDT